MAEIACLRASTRASARAVVNIFFFKVMSRSASSVKGMVLLSNTHPILCKLMELVVRSPGMATIYVLQKCIYLTWRNTPVINKENSQGKLVLVSP